MSCSKYTDNKNTQIVLALLKAHGIKKVIASPGTTNIALVASMMYDPWFELYSSVDERSAAYIACGLASESGEPVVLTCTGATASRNYFPGLTEAFYRKLPILAITGSHGEDHLGHLIAQSMDRTQAPKDTVVFSSSIKLSDTEWKVTTETNKAILALTHRGGGPAHLNLESAAYGTFNTEILPSVRVIKRYSHGKDYPTINAKNIAIFIGSHKPFTLTETNAIERFCECNNAAVFCDHTSGYKGKFAVRNALHASQIYCDRNLYKADLLIHIGEITGEFYEPCKFNTPQTWRVSEDGEIRDRFGNLTAVFESGIDTFFEYYSKDGSCSNISYYEYCKNEHDAIFSNLPDLPFGNIWMVQQMHDKLPVNSIVHFSIFNTLRSWNFFELDSSIHTSCNVGGFGIDGPLSTMIGQSLADPEKINFAFVGDLSFFYDMNSLGNRHIGANVRILLVNNGCGTEFRNFDHPASKWGDDADLFMAAGGHFGSQSKDLVKHFAEDLGFEYNTADSKDTFLKQMPGFLSSKKTDRPIIFEVFTTPADESRAIELCRNIVEDDRSITEKAINKAKSIVKSIIRE